jgi:hypothetical protein
VCCRCADIKVYRAYFCVCVRVRVCARACARTHVCLKLSSLQFPYALFAELLPGDCISYHATVLAWLGNNKQVRP